MSSATNYCAGGSGVDVSLSGSQAGITYQLYNGAAPVGAPMSGTGSALDFGMQLAPGTYTVMANNAATTCTNNMSNSVSITVNPLPVLVAVTGGGSYCAGGSGVHIGVGGSVSGIRYDLYNGSTLSGSMTGSGGSLDFGLKTAAGTYIVVATNAATLCARTMSGSAVVSINAVPVTFTMAGGGSYCAGGAGADIALAGSQSGVNYQLYNSGLPTGSPMSGTGSALDFGMRTASGVYTITGTNTTTGCNSSMSGSATINVLTAPTVFTVTGGGAYCNGSGGVHIGLSGSTSGIRYQYWWQ